MDWNTMTMEEYDREISRRMARRRWRELGEALGVAVTVAAIGLLVFGWMWATPPQASGECDRARVALEEVAK